MSLPSSYPSSPTENGTLTTDARGRPSAKSTLEENAYEDIVGKHSGSVALKTGKGTFVSSSGSCLTV